MANRLDLNKELCDILGSNYVYFQPPASISMKYPCIRYTLSGIDVNRADDTNYTSTKQYTITVMDRNPDSDIPDKILNHFRICRFDRSYQADNLNHFILTLYY